jgi:hypothetical protein
MDIYNYPTKHREGFTSEEMRILCEELNIPIDIFSEELGVNTGMIKDGDFLTYHTDIERTVRCIVENRDMRVEEWD